MTSPIVITWGKSGFPLLICISVFLHTNFLTSIYNEVDRFTNERHSTTIGTIGLPRLARSLLTLIGSCRIYSVFKIKAGSPFSILLLQSLC